MRKSAVSLPENFSAISYGSRLDPFGFKIKTVCFERLTEAFSLLFFKPFLAMRDKILSSDYCVPDKLSPLRTLILLFQHATCVKKTAHEYFVSGSQRYVLIAFK